MLCRDLTFAVNLALVECLMRGYLRQEVLFWTVIWNIEDLF